MAKVIIILLATIAAASPLPIVPPNAPPPIFGEHQESYGTPSFDAPASAPAPTRSAASFHAPSSPSYNAPPPPVRVYQQSSEEVDPPKYTYNYAVQDGYSGVDFNQQESRDGYNTQGAYNVALPDGRRQKVTYFVDGDSGYVAEVSYEGEAQYPSVERQETYRSEPRYQ